jgi:hypothetical protein
MSEEISIENLFKDSTARENLAVDNEISINELFGVEEPPIELQTNKEFIFENEDINEPIEDKESKIKELKSQLEVEDKELFVPLNELKKDRQKRFDDRLVKIKELQELTNSPELQELENIVKFDEEEQAVPKLRKLYSEFGLRFEETGLGDAMKVYTDKDKDGITIDLDTFTYKGAEEEVKKLKDYISSNKTDFDKTTINKLKDAKGNPTAFLNLYNENVIKEENEKIQSNLNYFDKELDKLNADQKNFNEQVVKFEYEVDKGLITKEQATQTQKDLIIKQNELNSKRSGLKSYFEKDIQGLASDIDYIQAEQTSILADRGTWVENWYNAVLDVPDLLNRVNVDVTNVIKDGIVDIKKYTGLIDSDEAEKQRAKNELEKNIRNEFSIKDEIGSDITNEYQQKFQETTFGAVSTSIVQMLGSSLIVPGTGPATFGAVMGGQEAGRVLEEMDAPAFDDVPDWQKVAFASSVGVAVAKLEKIGASAIIGKNPLAKRIVLNVLKKQGGKKVASGTIKDIIEQTIENKFLRGGFSVGVGGGMEGVTEVAQEVTEVGFKNAFNEVKNVFREDDKEFFTKEQTELDKDNLLQAFKVGTLAGGAFGTMNAFVEASNRKVVDQLNEEQYKRARAFYTDPQSLKNYSTKIRIEYAKGNITKDQLRNEERSIRELGGIFREIRKSTRLTTEGEKRVFSLIQQKKALQKQIDEADDKSLVAKQKESISEINSQIEDIIKDPTYDFDKSFARLKEVTKVEAEEAGKEFKVLDDNNFNKELSNLGLDESNYKGSTGYIHTDGNIYINETVAENLREIPVTSHELLHGILNKQLSNKTKEQSEKIVKDFKNKLNKSQRQAVNQRLQEAYGKSEDDATSQEWFTALSDGIVNNEVAFEESGFQSLGRLLTNVFLKPFGYKNASFKTGKQAFNFVRDYANQSRAIAQGKQQTFEGQVGEIVSEGIEAGVEGARSIQETNATELASQYKNGTIDSDNITNFIEQYHKLGLRAMKFDTSKGDIARDEAISFLNKEFESVVRNYDPTKNIQFSTYLNSVIPKRAVNFYEQQIGDKTKTTSADSDKAKQIAAEEETSRDVRTEREIRQAERKGVKVREKLPKVYDVDKVVKSIRSKAKSLKAKNIKQLKGTALEEASMMIGRDEELGKSIFRKISKNADLNKPEMLAIQKFINSNIDIAKGSLLEGYTSEFKATGVVNKLLEKFYNKRSVRAKTGPGLKVQIKKPNISDVEFKEAFGIIGKDQTNWNQKVVASKGGVSDILKGFVRNFDQVISSQEIREQLIEDGEVEQALMTLKDGMPSGFFSKINQDQKVEFLAYSNNFLNNIVESNLGVKNINDVLFKTFINENKSDVWGKTIEEKQKSLRELGKNIKNATQKYLTKKEKLKSLPKFGEFVIEEINQGESATNLIKSLKLKIKSFAEAFSTKNLITEQRGLEVDFTNDLVSKYGKRKAVELSLKILKGHNATSGKIGGGRNQIWKGLPDYIDNNLNTIPGVEIKYSQRVDKNGKINTYITSINIDGKSVDIDTTSPAQKSKNKKHFEDTYSERIKAADEAWNLLIDYLSFIHKNGTSLNFGMTMMSLKSNMQSMLKAAAPVKYYYVGPPMDASKLRYEHIIPTEYIVLKLTQHFYGKKIDLKALKDKYNVAIVPKTMDKNFDVQFQKVMPTFWNETMPETQRYFGELMKGFPNMYALEVIGGKDKGKIIGEKFVELSNNIVNAEKVNKKEASLSNVIDTKNMTNEQVIGQFSKADEALKFARDPNTPVKKIRVFDFDDTLATTKSDVLFTATDGTKGKLNAEEFAKQGKDLLDEGYVFDFSEFNKVTKGKPGPLLEVAKKIQAARGTEDVFVLTARAPEAQVAIKEFLDGVGLNIPLKNIAGLGNSTGEAKANWLVGKAAEGYNDFYFADDAYQNVKAVKDAMSVLDVKSKVQQAKGQFSKNVNEDFNKIIEQTTGIASEKVYSEAKAKVRGANKGNKKFFIPYSAEDFMGLIYPLLSKGKLGDSQMAWFKQNLLDPYARAQENLSTDRLQLMEDFKALKKALEVPKDLRKKTDSGFTKEQAVRVYLFNKAGFDVPGISKTDLNELLDLVNSDGVLKAFGDQIFNITKGDGYAKPGENWLVGTITTDLIDVLNTVKRAKYLEQSGYTANAELIFSKENLNKLEAAYGTKYREAMENILGRMKSGKNRLFSGNRLSNRVLDYINNSTGAIMFFNTRSAVLQTISSINFLNWSFNNPIKAGAAFANQPQYWKDFVELINSDYLVDRRNGLKLNINESEIADAAATSKNKAKAAINYILQKGFLPTQYADSFAIASGGATFYRNRINDLVKNQGMSEADAKKQAMLEWRETAEISQQSSDPSKISAQQASDLGRVILAFANTPMQYARIQKRAVQDLIKGRGDAKTHVSKIIYYAVVQNLIFNALQSALFGLGFGDDEDDEKKEKMYLRTANGMLDSQLRGLGLAGATVAVIKNFLTDIYERSGRSRPEYVDSVYELLRVSPPISNKISKIRGAAWEFDSKKRRQEIFDKGFSIDNPAYEAGAKVISATTNIPLDRVYSKVDNISGAMSEDAETWQTVAMLAGWPKWTIMPKEKSSEELPKFSGAKIKKFKKYDYKKKTEKGERRKFGY